jgi:hypothetical protein
VLSADGTGYVWNAALGVLVGFTEAIGGLLGNAGLAFSAGIGFQKTRRMAAFAWLTFVTSAALIVPRYAEVS